MEDCVKTLNALGLQWRGYVSSSQSGFGLPV